MQIFLFILGLAGLMAMLSIAAGLIIIELRYPRINQRKLRELQQAGHAVAIVSAGLIIISFISTVMYDGGASLPATPWQFVGVITVVVSNVIIGIAVWFWWVQWKALNAENLALRNTTGIKGG